MVAAVRHERATAAAILAAATLLAAWIMFHRPPQLPVRVVEQKASKPEKLTPQPPQDSPADTALKFEIVELPPAPAPSPPAPAPATAAPAPPPPVQVARAEPVPEKAPAAAPRPEMPPQQKAAVAPPPVTPLKPDAKPRTEIAPLRVEVPLEGPAPPAKPLQLLRPGDEKASDTPLPIQPLHVEPEAVVSRETKSTLSPEPAPPAQKFMPSAPRPVAPKTEAWVPKLKQRPPERAPEPEPVAEPAPAPAKASAAPMIHVEAVPAPAAPIPEKEVATEGRVLLRMFEQGAGPSVEIRWPAQASERDRLYDVFTQCLGMKVGLLDDQGHVYLGEGPRQQAMAINLDKYSGFVRRPEGAIASDEQREIARIRAYHGMAAPPARMFPRRVDAYLLGGLRATVGDQYLKMKSVRATYRLSGRRVMIESIVADGRAVDGVIDLSTVASCN